MSKIQKYLIVALLLCSASAVNAQVWKTSNIRAKFGCPAVVTVTYDLVTSKSVDLTLYYSTDEANWIPAETVTGVTAQTSGKDKTIIWDCVADGVSQGKLFYKVEADTPCTYVSQIDEATGIELIYCKEDIPEAEGAIFEVRWSPAFILIFDWNSKVPALPVFSGSFGFLKDGTYNELFGLLENEVIIKIPIHMIHGYDENSNYDGVACFFNPSQCCVNVHMENGYIVFYTKDIFDRSN